MAHDGATSKYAQRDSQTSIVVGADRSCARACPSDTETCPWLPPPSITAAISKDTSLFACCVMTELPRGRCRSPGYEARCTPPVPRVSLVCARGLLPSFCPPTSAHCVTSHSLVPGDANRKSTWPPQTRNESSSDPGQRTEADTASVQGLAPARPISPFSWTHRSQAGSPWPGAGRGAAPAVPAPAHTSQPATHQATARGRDPATGPSSSRWTCSFGTRLLSGPARRSRPGTSAGRRPRAPAPCRIKRSLRARYPARCGRSPRAALVGCAAAGQACAAICGAFCDSKGGRVRRSVHDARAVW